MASASSVARVESPSSIFLSYFHLSFKLSTIYGVHLVGWGWACRFWPPPHIFAASKNGCLDIVCPQSSVKINQISLDESGEHVGICSEDGKVSATDVTHHCPHNTTTILVYQWASSPQVTWIIAFLNLLEIIWNLECAIAGFYTTVGALTWSCIITLSARKPFFFFLLSWFRKSLKACASFTDSGRGLRSDVQSCQSAISRQRIPSPCSLPYLLSCLFSSLPPSFMDFAVKICSLISPLLLLWAVWWQKKSPTRSCRTKKVEQTIKINARAIVFPQPFQAAANPLKI